MQVTRKFLLAAVLAAGVLACVALVSAQSSTDHTPYKFKYLIGDIVAWNGDWWEVSARVEARHCEDGNIYPWYYLERPNNGKTEFIWVWAPPVDNTDEASRLDPSTRNQDCCPDPPPPCPQPPCFEGSNP